VYANGLSTMQIDPTNQKLLVPPLFESILCQINSVLGMHMKDVFHTHHD